MEYELMHGHISVAVVTIDDDGYLIGISSVSEPDHLPVGTLAGGEASVVRLRRWWSGRSIPASREGVRHLLDSLDIPCTGSLSLDSMGSSLSDQYWIRPRGSHMQWEDVNFFGNAFSPYIGDLLFGRAATAGTDRRSPDNTTDGVQRKRWVVRDGVRCLIKSGSEPCMQEPFNEVIATILMDSNGIPNAGYSLIWNGDIPCSVCPDFISPDTELVSAGQILADLCTTAGKSHPEMFRGRCTELGLDVDDFVDSMTVMDDIMLNTDRHLGNFGLIRNAETLEWIGPAPIYDTGNSLMCRKGVPSILRMVDEPVGRHLVPGPIDGKHLRWFDPDAMLDRLDDVSALLAQADGRIDEMDAERRDALVSLLERNIRSAAADHPRFSQP